jgi:hypothetical protein
MPDVSQWFSFCYQPFFEFSFMMILPEKSVAQRLTVSKVFAVPSDLIFPMQ